MTIKTISLSKLIPSRVNVRKAGAGQGIDELAASIVAHGLLQNLQVRTAAKGKFEVIAGGRRLAALKLLLKQKKLDKEYEVPCHVLEGEDAGEISLAENIMRLAMHPADQFEAFKALIDDGKGIEDIAARFGTSPTIVRQRLKLASVSPVLIDLYRDEKMTLDQLMAFTVSDDHTAQEAAWSGLPNWQRDAAAIRRNLTAAHVAGDDRRVSFVTLEAYLAAGGTILRDLFQPEHEGYITDPALLDRMTGEKLDREAATTLAEGWKWVETSLRLDYGALHGFKRVYAEPVPLSEDEQGELDRLGEEYDSLIEEHGDDPEDDIAQQLQALSDRIDTLSAGRHQWETDDLACAGAIVTINHGGALQIERGLVRAEDAKARRSEGGVGSQDPSKSSGGLSATLIEDLTAHRTMALRAMMTENTPIALAALAHALALPLFYGTQFDVSSSLDMRITSRSLRLSAGVSEGKAGTTMASHQDTWRTALPSDPADLFAWLCERETDTITRLLAYCAAQSVDGVQSKLDRANCPRLKHGSEVAAVLNLDMKDWWTATKESYFGRVSKAFMLDAVSEGVSSYAARDLGNLKKDALAAAAVERLAGTNWMPAIFRAEVEVEAEREEAAVEQVAAE